MKKTTKKSLSFLLAVLIVCPSSLGVNAWGPDARPTFTIDDPPGYVTFNSITDDPKWGDERAFASIKPAGAPNSEYSYQAELQPGQTYDVIAYYHNNASESLNGDNYDGAGVAQGAYAQVNFPPVVDGEAKGTVAFGATNASPQEVWSTITFTSERSLTLRVVGGSAKLHNFAQPVSGSEERTFDLPMELFSEGTPIGFDAMNGILPGCNFYSGYITFQVNVPNPKFTFKAEVKKGTEGEWQKDLSAVNPQVGDTLRFMMYYANTGDVIQDDVVFSSDLIEGLGYVDGSTEIRTSTADGPWTRPATHDTITSVGLNLGDFEPGAEAYVIFEAEVIGNSMDAVFSVDTDNGGLDAFLKGEVSKEKSLVIPIIIIASAAVLLMGAVIFIVVKVKKH